MSVSQFADQSRRALRKASISTGRTLKQSEMNDGVITGATGTMTLTIPPITSAMKDYRFIVTNQGGADALKVFVAAGFGGKGASYDTVTLARGDFADFYIDGSYAYVNNATVAAGS